MAETIRVGVLDHSGFRVVIEVEEGKNFRRILLLRQRLIFGDYQDVGRVHIYVDEVEKVVGMLKIGSAVMSAIGEVGFEEAAKEMARLKEKDNGSS